MRRALVSEALESEICHMIEVLKHPIYARLFSAQVIALLGTGLLTVALALLVFDLAGDKAGAVLGTAFAIKMIAYVGLAPVANAVSEKLPRKAVLIGADLVRATVALYLPFIDSVWQIYALIFVLQAASATFTPAFQAIIPDILKDEKDYTKALSLSRLAYDLENLISPALAGLLLTFMSYHWLFGGTLFGFVASAALVSLVSLPPIAKIRENRPFFERLTRGARIYLATPRLRGLLALNLAAAAAGAFIMAVSKLKCNRHPIRGCHHGPTLSSFQRVGAQLTPTSIEPRQQSGPDCTNTRSISLDSLA